MKFIAFSDMHFYRNSAKSYVRSDGLTSWFYEQVRLCREIFDFALTNNVKTVIHNGDLFEEKNNINQVVYNVVWELFREYYEKGLLIYLNTGNHDLSTLSDQSITLKPFSSVATVITDEYSICNIRIVPFGKLSEYTLKTDSKESFILFTHEVIEGLSWGTTEHPRTSPSKYDRSMFSKWTYVFNGHIHKPQIILPNIINIGSPMPHDFGEVDDDKHFIFYDEGEVKFIAPDYQKMYHLKELDTSLINDRDLFWIDIDEGEINNPIFDRWNVIRNTVKRSSKRVFRLKDAKSDKDIIEEYINLKGPNLDREKLLKIGIEIIT